MVSKLSLKISIKDDCYWVSFNEILLQNDAKKIMASYYWGNIGLKIEED